MMVQQLMLIGMAEMEAELGHIKAELEWEEFLDELINRHIEDFRNGHAGIYTRDHLATSSYYEVRGINAS